MSAEKWIAEPSGGIDALRLVRIAGRAPGPGEVTIAVRAAGMNPIDYKNLYGGWNSAQSVGFEVAGVVSAVGAATSIASGPAPVGRSARR